MYDMLIEVGEVYTHLDSNTVLFGIMIIGTHNSVTSVTSMMMFCASSRSISSFSLLR